ncbi:hypothetical protein RHRU231_870040 [Rhodococcus ruber]|uniref:Uncharacterized protein n=1 Tax=Rhodococcus ruber TaxID=1830 RepID=A0A098BVN4_9NOCA|nr:hypothetical protein RHRU231_870040 [Rhodococcus ruber]
MTGVPPSSRFSMARRNGSRPTTRLDRPPVRGWVSSGRPPQVSLTTSSVCRVGYRSHCLVSITRSRAAKSRLISSTASSCSAALGVRPASVCVTKVFPSLGSEQRHFTVGGEIDDQFPARDAPAFRLAPVLVPIADGHRVVPVAVAARVHVVRLAVQLAPGAVAVEVDHVLAEDVACGVQVRDRGEHPVGDRSGTGEHRVVSATDQPGRLHELGVVGEERTQHGRLAAVDGTGVPCDDVREREAILEWAAHAGILHRSTSGARSSSH